MLDPKLFSEQPDLVASSLKARGSDVDLASIQNLIEARKTTIQTLEAARAQSKETSEKLHQAFQKSNTGDKNKAEDWKKEASSLKATIKQHESKLSNIEEELNDLLLRVPNILHPSVPCGKDDSANEVVRVWNEDSKKESAKDHHDIGVETGAIDFERGAKLAGSRFSVLFGGAAQLEMALIQFMFNKQIERGYTPVLTPYLVHPVAMMGTGQLPKFKQDAFCLENESHYLVPTAEVPVTNLHADEILDEEELPKKYVAFSPCFRSEAGSYGRDTRGLIRQHQFHKVELVKICHPESGMKELESLTLDAENILKLLELPYRTVALCSGDIGFGATKCYDLEVWLPGSKAYREISSCSYFLDFQTRRMNLRYRAANKRKPLFAHTINGSGLAVGRALIAVVETYYQGDGVIALPSALRPYLNNQETLKL